MNNQPNDEPNFNSSAFKNYRSPSSKKQPKTPLCTFKKSDRKWQKGIIADLLNGQEEYNKKHGLSPDGTPLGGTQTAQAEKAQAGHSKSGHSK